MSWTGPFNYFLHDLVLVLSLIPGSSAVSFSEGANGLSSSQQRRRMLSNGRVDAGGLLMDIINDDFVTLTGVG